MVPLRFAQFWPLSAMKLIRFLGRVKWLRRYGRAVFSCWLPIAKDGLDQVEALAPAVPGLPDFMTR